MSNMLNGVKFDDYLKLSKKQRDYIRIKTDTNEMDKDIAEQINTSNVTISRWKNKADFMRGFKAYQAHHLESAIPKALRTMVSLLDARSELVKFNAAKDILDRTGYNPVEKQEIEHSGLVSFHDDIN